MLPSPTAITAATPSPSKKPPHASSSAHLATLSTLSTASLVKFKPDQEQNPHGRTRTWASSTSPSTARSLLLSAAMSLKEPEPNNNVAIEEEVGPARGRSTCSSVYRLALGSMNTQ